MATIKKTPPPIAKKTPTPPPSKGGKIAKKVATSSGNPANTKAAVQWLMAHVRDAEQGRVVEKEVLKNVARGKQGIGCMYFFAYDPKFKATLPYYDKFPLVIPIELYSDGFLGLNLHYLPPMKRAQLLDNLMELERKAGTPQAFMQVSYAMLAKVAGVKGYDKCIKRYLTSKIKTRLIKIESDYWETAAMLPVQEFRGASSSAIWR